MSCTLRNLLLVIIYSFFLSACVNGEEEVGQDTVGLSDSPKPATVNVHAQPLLEDIRPIGLNLGQWTYWGAEQLGRNILMNPGFEGVVDRSLVRVTHPGRSTFSDDQRWLGREDGFWSQATYAVMTGSASGDSGVLLDSRKQGRHALPEYFPRRMPSGLAEGDIIALTRIADNALPSHWWFSDADTGRFKADRTHTRPDSPGLRSLLVQPLPGQGAWLASHLDTIGERAGKLRPVNGRWLLSLWIHGNADHRASVRITFRRHGNPSFIDLELRPEAGWHRLDHYFDAQDDGPVGPLELRLEVNGGEIRIDDIWLGPHEAAFDPLADASPQSHFGFAPEVIARLAQLRPGYLRDWQGQLGDTLENRLAPSFARRASRYRPGNPFYLYGLDEFLALNRHLGSSPWLVMPTTFSVDEARQLGVWLAQRIAQHGFEEVLVEFGNENWNSIFRAAGIQDPRHHGFAADRLIRALRDGAGNHPALRSVINAQHANPDFALAFDHHSREADIVAIAPYLLHRLDQADTGAMLGALFKDDEGRMKRLADGLGTRRELAVYEVNLHATGGDASESARNALVTSPAAGAALARRLLESMAAGATRQSLYRLTGFDTQLNDGNGLVRLFGITRNLHEPDALRPSAWAMIMLNQVIQPHLHAADLSGGGKDQLTIAAFSGAQGWSAAIVSALPVARTVRLQFPDDGRALPTHAQMLAGLPGHFDGRETALAPDPAHWQQTGPSLFEITVPAYGLVTLMPRPGH